MIQVLTVGVFAFGCLAALLSPGWAVALALSMYTLEQGLQASSGLFFTRPALCNIIVALVVGVTAVRHTLSNPGNLRGHANAMFIGTLIIYGWSAFSLAWTPSTTSAMEMISWGFPYFILFVLVVPLLVDNIEEFGSIARASMYLGTLVLGAIIINPEFTSSSGRLGFDIGGGHRSNPLAIGELGGALIIIASLLRVGPKQWLLNAGRIAAFGVGAVIALQSGSRGQLLFAVILAVVFLPIAKRVKSFPNFIITVLGVITIVSVVGFIASSNLGLDIVGRWDASALEGGSTHRVTSILDLLGAWARSPVGWVMGLGVNAFSSVTDSGSQEHYSHNITVDVLAELGLLIFTLFVYLWFVVVQSAIWLFRRFAESPIERTNLAVLLALVTYQFLLANKQSNLWGNGMLFCFAVILVRVHRRTVAADEECEDVWSDAGDSVELESAR